MTKDQDIAPNAVVTKDAPKTAVVDAPGRGKKGGDQALASPKAKLRQIQTANGMAFSQSDHEKGQATAAALAEGPQFQIYLAPLKKGSRESKYVLLADINNVRYWAKRGEHTTVPLEVARIAFEAGQLGEGHPPPPGAGKPLDAMFALPEALLDPSKVDQMGD